MEVQEGCRFTRQKEIFKSVEVKIILLHLHGFCTCIHRHVTTDEKSSILAKLESTILSQDFIVTIYTCNREQKPSRILAQSV